MSPSDEFRVKLTGPGITIERAISAEVVQKITLLLLSDGRTEIAHSTPPQTPIQPPAIYSPPQTPVSQSSARPHQSLREFLSEVGPVRIAEKIATIGYYLEKHGHPNGFSRQDLIKGFGQAKEAVPGNIPRDVTLTIKVGWIAPNHQNGDIFYVTKSGLEAVESKFPEELRKKTKVSEGGRKKKATPKQHAKK